MTGILAQTGSGISGPPWKLRQNEQAYWTDTAYSDRFNNTLDSNSYKLTYAFAGPGTPFQVVATAGTYDEGFSGVGGGGWTTQLTSGQASGLTPAGKWWWQAILTILPGITGNNPARIVAAEGEVTFEPDLSTLATTFDGRSDSEKAYDLFTAAYQALATGSVKSYEIAGRRMQYRDLAEIQSAINYYRGRIAAEKQKASGGQDRFIRIGFSPASSGSQVSNSKNWPWW